MNLSVLLGREAGEVFEIIDEMRLIVKAAFKRDLAPIDIVGGIDRSHCFLKPHYLQI